MPMRRFSSPSNPDDGAIVEAEEGGADPAWPSPPKEPVTEEGLASWHGMGQVQPVEF
ncbi:hypothetical protein AcW1_008789 [Taiwanofungus camphoratus]|nr:hypothetical protein AcV5_006820 [Antrodia cinnamomea]KAI0935231.1 hypothetical protein AcV7_003727 [Antrodia cinnamomea]KAI0949089.1 hypothetical protein AcW1_008789 [Antrodia cinnamomea]